jgi:hypothetical protein
VPFVQPNNPESFKDPSLVTMKIHYGTTLMSLMHTIHEGYKDSSTPSGFREL